MSTKKVALKLSDLKKLHKALKNAEKSNKLKTIENVSLSGFLASSLEMTISGNLEFDIKQAILNAAGQFTTDPSVLDNGTLMKENLNFNDSDFTSLTRGLNSLIKNYGKNVVVSLTDVSKCKKVSDVVKLVKGKINPPINI